ncbi:hypothetical protein BH11PSE13_BH11PSE13_10140 [soil metagenome]
MTRCVWIRTALAGLLFTAAGVAVSAPTEILKEVPAKGAVPRGDVVYVDDGKCPAGEVKKIIGGDQKTGMPRQVTCVKRPD